MKYLIATICAVVLSKEIVERKEEYNLFLHSGNNEGLDRLSNCGIDFEKNEYIQRFIEIMSLE